MSDARGKLARCRCCQSAMTFDSMHPDGINHKAAEALSRCEKKGEDEIRHTRICLISPYL